MSFLGTWNLAGQNIPNASSRTVPTREKFEKTPSPTDGLITPEAILPEGFTSKVKQFDFSKFQDEGNSLLEGRGGVKVTTDKGDTITSEKITLDFSEQSDSRVIFYDNVELRAKNGIEVFADKATLDQSTETIVFSGNVSAYQGTALHRGETATFNYETGRMETINLRTSVAPIMLESGNFKILESSKGKYYKGTNAAITTHDAENPNFWLRADEITVIPGDRVRLRRPKLYLGDRPVLWLPNLTQKFNGKLNYRPTPGGRSNWGPFLLNEYSQDFGGLIDPTTGEREDPTHELTYHADIYSRRGLGLGLDIDSYALKDNPNLGTISGYFIHDFDSTIRRSAESRGNFDRTDRFRLQVRQRADLSVLPGAKGHVDIDSTLLSDEFFLEDFRTRDFTTDFNPDNVVSLSQSWLDKYLLTVWARFRINDFYQSDQRLPEIALDQIRRPIFGTPILHESRNSIGIYREDLASSVEDSLLSEASNPATSLDRLETVQELLADTGFARAHTYHELSLPLRLQSGLNIVPRVGLGHTSYRNAQGPVDSFDRNIFAASIDASLKFSKRYPDWISKKWGLDSALHVIQPYATASFLQADELDPSIQPIDRLAASVRPRALQPGRFAAIDELRDSQILRLGVRNQILTKRDGSSHQWLYIDSYVDFFGQDPEFDRTASNLYTDLHWSPLPWLDLTVETQVPLFSDSNFTEVATGLRLMPGPDTEFSISHRFLQDHPILSDSSRLQLRGYHRINEEWGVGAIQNWEFSDNSLEFQQYSIYRNLDSWAINAGFFTRDNSDELEFGVLFGFTLTEFPSISPTFNFDN